MSASYAVGVIAICAACTFAERLLPFIVFRGRAVPEVIRYLGRYLPMAVMATLVVYCLRSTDFSALSGCVPQLAAALLTALLHVWKGNTLLSVVGGTACYMILIRLIL